jgi:RNA polymerase sigma-70 factor (ECF subfamily)
LDEAEFASVLEAARVGADWAWSRLYADLAPPVLGYLRTRGAAEPEDLLGEVFLQLARNLPTFSGDYGGFRSWVFGIAYHRVIDERRYRALRPADPGDVPESSDVQNDPADLAAESLTTAAIVALLGTLTAGQRDVLLLRIVAGLTIDEVATVMGKRIGAVKALQRRGVRELRQRIDGVPLDALPPVARVR